MFLGERLAAPWGTQAQKSAVRRIFVWCAMLFAITMNRKPAISFLKAITFIGVYGGLLLPLAFFPVVIFPFVFSKLIFFQVLIGLTFPAYLVLAWAEPQYRPKMTPLLWAILAYFAAVGLSVIFAADPARAWWGNQERMNGLFTLLHFLAWCVMTIGIIKTWQQWKKLLIYEVVLSGVMAIVALWQRVNPNLLSFPAGTDRIGGLLDNPIYMAAYQIFNLFFIALLWMREEVKFDFFKTWWSNVKAKKSFTFFPTLFKSLFSLTFLKIFLIVCAVLDIGAFLGAETRGALVGVAAGLVVFCIAFALMTKSKKARLAVFTPLILLVVGYGILFAARNTSFVQHSELGRFTNFNESVDTRFIAWDIAWKGFLERPLTGWGFDNFHILFNLKYNPRSLEFSYYETWFDRAHNTVMDALAMTGIPGTLTFFGIFGALFYMTYRGYKRGWIDNRVASIFYALPVAYFVQNLFVFDQPAGFTMSFFMYALVICATTGPGFFDKSQGTTGAAPVGATGSKNMPWIGYAILQLAGILLVWRMSVLPAEASYQSIMSNNYFAQGSYAQAFALAQSASQIPTPYLDEQSFLQARNVITLLSNGTYKSVSYWKQWHDLIVDVTNRQMAVHPLDTHSLFIYARFLDSFSAIVPEDKVLAEKEYIAAIATSPKRQQLYFNLGRFYLENGQKQKGLDTFKQAEEFDPNVGEAHWYVGVAEFYDLDDKVNGAQELLASQKAAVPYVLQNAQEALTLSGGLDQLKDKADFLAVLDKLPTLSGGTVEMFLQFARVAEDLGLTEQRNIILQAIIHAQPSIEPHLAPLLTLHTATSIQESFSMTQTLDTQPVQTPSATPAPAKTAAPTPSKAPVDAGSGPRR